MHGVHPLFWFDSSSHQVREYLQHLKPAEWSVLGKRLMPAARNYGITPEMDLQVTLTDLARTRCLTFDFKNLLEGARYGGTDFDSSPDSDPSNFERWLEAHDRSADSGWVLDSALKHEEVLVGFLDRSVQAPFQLRKLGDIVPGTIFSMQVVKHPNRAWIPGVVTEYKLDLSKGSVIAGNVATTSSDLTFEIVP